MTSRSASMSDFLKLILLIPILLFVIPFTCMGFVARAAYLAFDKGMEMWDRFLDRL